MTSEIAIPPSIPPSTSGNDEMASPTPRASVDANGTTSVTSTVMGEGSGTFCAEAAALSNLSSVGASPASICATGALAADAVENLGRLTENDCAVGLARLDQVDRGGPVTQPE